MGAYRRGCRIVEPISVLIGFLVGIVAAGFAVELGLKKFLSPPESGKLTNVWSLTELASPLIVATQIADLAVPKASRMVTAHNLQVPQEGFQVRKNGDAKGNFAVDAANNRALLFLGGIEPRALALWTVDEQVIERLRAEFNRLWTRSTDYIETVTVAEIPFKANHTVATRGTVQGIVPYRNRYLLRLADQGETVGVLVDRELPLHGARVEVVGVVKASGSGFPMVEAIEVKREA